MLFYYFLNKMSVMIRECADRLVEKFQKLAENKEKMDAKLYGLSIKFFSCFKILNIFDVKTFQCFFDGRHRSLCVLREHQPFGRKRRSVYDQSPRSI